MIRVAQKKDKEIILDILRENIVDNIYLYMDILLFGLNNEYITIWINEEKSKINQIILKYYDSYQIYSRISSYDDIVNLILRDKPSMISGTQNVISEIHKNLNGEYDANYGIVLEQEKVQKTEIRSLPILATLEDMEEIARLICIDKDIGGHYSKDILEKQLSTRFQEGTGRNYIIKKENNIIGHYATYAETPEMAVMGGLIVHPTYRRQGYAKLLHTHLSSVLINEGKRVFLFCKKDILKMYLSLGSKICAKYGKLTPKKKGE